MQAQHGREGRPREREQRRCPPRGKQEGACKGERGRKLEKAGRSHERWEPPAPVKPEEGMKRNGNKNEGKEEKKRLEPEGRGAREREPCEPRRKPHEWAQPQQA